MASSLIRSAIQLGFITPEILWPGWDWIFQDLLSNTCQGSMQFPRVCLLPGELCMGSQIARFMGPTWGPSGADRTQVDPTLFPWTLLSGVFLWVQNMIFVSQFFHYTTCKIMLWMTAIHDYNTRINCEQWVILQTIYFSTNSINLVFPCFDIFNIYQRGCIKVQ